MFVRIHFMILAILEVTHLLGCWIWYIYIFFNMIFLGQSRFFPSSKWSLWHSLYHYFITEIDFYLVNGNCFLLLFYVSVENFILGHLGSSVGKVSALDSDQDLKSPGTEPNVGLLAQGKVFLPLLLPLPIVCMHAFSQINEIKIK